MTTKPSRYATTSYNRGERIKARILDVYARARAFRLHSDTIRDLLTPIYQSADYRKLTQWQRGYVAGLIDGNRNELWNRHVVWMLGPASGPIRVAGTEWTDQMSRLSRLPGELYGGHFWLDDNGQPTDRPFTDYKPTN